MNESRMCEYKITLTTGEQIVVTAVKGSIFLYNGSWVFVPGSGQKSDTVYPRHMVRMIQSEDVVR